MSSHRPPPPSSSYNARSIEEHRRIARERIDAQIRARQGIVCTSSSHIRRSNSDRHLMTTTASSHTRRGVHDHDTNNANRNPNLYRSNSLRGFSERRPEVPPLAVGETRIGSSSSHARISHLPSSSSHSRVPSKPTSVKVHHHDPAAGIVVDSDSALPRTVKERLEEYKATKGKTNGVVASQIVDAEDATMVQYLAVQAYHLPGYSCRQDWCQFMLNNHPVLGIFCHHPLHPIKSCTRVVALIGSLVVGLAITNLFYLFYLWNPQFNQPLVQVTVGEGEDEPSSSSSGTTLTTGMLLLWTLGGCLHAGYNLFQWYMAACACCRPGGLCETHACCPSLGKHLLRVLVAVIIAMAVLIILLRVAITNQEQELDQRESQSPINNKTMVEYTDSASSKSDGIHFLDDDGIQFEVHDVSEFEFLLGYIVETILAMFVYYPLGGTILFSGILVCGKLPILGGRPFEIRAEERRLARQQRRQERRIGGTKRIEGSWSDTTDEEADAVIRLPDEEEGRGAIPVQHYRTHRFN